MDTERVHQRSQGEGSGFGDRRRKWAKRAAVLTAPLIGIVEGVLFRTRALKVFGRLLVIAVLVSLMGSAMAVSANYIAESVPGISTDDAFGGLVVVVVVSFFMLLFRR